MFQGDMSIDGCINLSQSLVSTGRHLVTTFVICMIALIAINFNFNTDQVLDLSNCSNIDHSSTIYPTVIKGYFHFISQTKKTLNLLFQ